MLNPKTIESEVRNATSERLLVDGTGERGTGRLGLRIRPGRPRRREDTEQVAGVEDGDRAKRRPPYHWALAA